MEPSNGCEGEHPPRTGTDTRNPRHILSKLLGKKEDEWTAVAKIGPPNLLDLPVDILKEIVRAVTHTNDLTSLALTHSALHALATPQIYSRFDIVWPDGNTTTDNRTGVDALTYGLATLVMARDVFGEDRDQKYSARHIHRCSQCGRLDQCPHPAKATPVSHRIRRGNDFAQYTRKFSLGNGPADWVQEYLITKEGGKMLGTLVALAIGRMRNLETFIWDMPTGVLRDVWLALGSLADRGDGHECRLERVWVRWHDNSETSSPPANPTLLSHSLQSANLVVGPSLPASFFQIPPYPRVEFPTFSILPPLKSLSALDIDELPYVQEMGILIERSLPRLRELRVGLAQHAQYDSWAILPEDKIHVESPTTDNASSSPWGLLGVLFGRLLDVFGDVDTGPSRDDTDNVQQKPPSSPPPAMIETKSVDSDERGHQTGNPSSILDSVSSAKETLEKSSTPTVNLDARMQELANSFTNLAVLDPPKKQCRSALSQIPLAAPMKLKLEVLELERISISILALSKSIDWSSLTSLTILGCPHHEQLWKVLRRKFSPRQALGTSSSPLKSPLRSPRTPSTPKTPLAPQSYQLKLKRLHTDSVSSALISFLRETLAPDTLEWLFLQENRAYPSSVSIDQIYRGPLRRHRESLTKVLIDSGDRLSYGNEVPSASHSTRARRWTLTREVLDFILSGRMSSLRELAVTLDYKDWHFFLQRLVFIPHLRSLHIPHIAEHVHGRNLDSRELALQILDVVALRPELELCYLGIQSKCFEILEYAAGHKPSLSDLASGSHGSGVGPDSDDDSDVAASHHHHDHQQQQQHHQHHHHVSSSQQGADDDDLSISDDHHDNDEDIDTDGDDDDDDDEASPTSSVIGTNGPSHPSHLSHPSSTDTPASTSSTPTLYQQHQASANINPTSQKPNGGRHNPTTTTEASASATKAASMRRKRKKAKVFKLREILFYDDKVAIFRARHARL